jgi:hypothetical protein
MDGSAVRGAAASETADGDICCAAVVIPLSRTTARTRPPNLITPLYRRSYAEHSGRGRVLQYTHQKAEAKSILRDDRQCRHRALVSTLTWEASHPQ